MAVLRRPQLPSDRYRPIDRLAMLPVAGVNPDAIRLATTLGKSRIYLIPAENVQYHLPLPDTEGCKQFMTPARSPVPGVCFVFHGAGASCTDAEGIKSGRSMMTSRGSTRGRTRVVGIAHDGVKAVIWRVHRGSRFLDTRVPVRNNVWAADVPGRHGHGLYVYFVTAKGRELVRGPHRLTRRERAQRSLDARRDRTAGPIPTVVPRTGGAKTFFTFRMRLARPDPRKQYVANWTGPRGTSCAAPVNNEIGMLPALQGPLRGLLKLPIGPPIATRRWCPGSYTGIVRAQRRGRTGAAGPVIATFSFSVRR
jgi:hypothetical protein